MCTTYRVVHKNVPNKNGSFTHSSVCWELSVAASFLLTCILFVKIRDIFMRHPIWHDMVSDIKNVCVFCILTEYRTIFGSFSAVYCDADFPKIIMPPPVGGTKQCCTPSVCPTIISEKRLILTLWLLQNTNGKWKLEWSYGQRNRHGRI